VEPVRLFLNQGCCDLAVDDQFRVAPGYRQPAYDGHDEDRFLSAGMKRKVCNLTCACSLPEPGIWSVIKRENERIVIKKILEWRLEMVLRKESLFPTKLEACDRSQK